MNKSVEKIIDIDIEHCSGAKLNIRGESNCSHDVSFLIDAGLKTERIIFETWKAEKILKMINSNTPEHFIEAEKIKKIQQHFDDINKNGTYVDVVECICYESNPCQDAVVLVKFLESGNKIIEHFPVKSVVNMINSKDSQMKLTNDAVQIVMDFSNFHKFPKDNTERKHKMLDELIKFNNF